LDIAGLAHRGAAVAGLAGGLVGHPALGGRIPDEFDVSRAHPVVHVDAAAAHCWTFALNASLSVPLLVLGWGHSSR
jgi:hypothetical protein